MRATKKTNLEHHKPNSPLAGMPISPSYNTNNNNSVIIRYFYDGGLVNQGRICHLPLLNNEEESTMIISSHQVMKALQDDGVDVNTFHACSYESTLSDGGWMPLEVGSRYVNPWTTNQSNEEEGLVFTIPEDRSQPRRIDIKLFHRPTRPNVDLEDAMEDIKQEQTAKSELSFVERTTDSLQAKSNSIPGGKLPLNGYFGIAIIHPKTSENVGTLWRSSFQLGASVLYTIGQRYKVSSTDTLNVPARIPLIECNDWSSFVEESSPKGAVWVAIEMGGVPLKEYKHPRNGKHLLCSSSLLYLYLGLTSKAHLSYFFISLWYTKAIYILGSEDHGVPKSVLRSCREVVSLEAEEYGSYNVAVAGSLVMYDRMTKMRGSSPGAEKN